MASLSDPLVKELLQGRYIATLATHNADGSIHMVAVWFWFDDTNLYIATASNTRKARNLQLNPHASLMVDSREAQASRGVTITGTAKLVTGDASRQYNPRVHAKYLSERAIADQRVGPVFEAWDNITIQLSPTSVFAWDLRDADKQAFGGALSGNPGYLLEPAR
ncbi:MAG: pyridoxamine 5'-phosphate oxidase family protein [Terriglobales bacterium]